MVADSFPHSYPIISVIFFDIVLVSVTSSPSYEFISFLISSRASVAEPKGTCQPCLMKKMSRGTRLRGAPNSHHPNCRLFATSKQLLPRYVQKAAAALLSCVFVLPQLRGETVYHRRVAGPQPRQQKGRLPNVSSRVPPTIGVIGRPTSHCVCPSFKSEQEGPLCRLLAKFGHFRFDL